MINKNLDVSMFYDILCKRLDVIKPENPVYVFRAQQQRQAPAIVKGSLLVAKGWWLAQRAPTNTYHTACCICFLCA